MKSETAQSFLTFCKINFWTHWCYKESLPKLKLPFSVDVVNLMSKSSASVIVHDISKSHVQWTLFMVHLVNILMYESYREKSQNGTITIYIELPRKTSNENIVLEKSYLCEKWAVSIFSTFDVWAQFEIWMSLGWFWGRQEIVYTSRHFYVYSFLQDPFHNIRFSSVRPF